MFFDLGQYIIGQPDSTIPQPIHSNLPSHQGVSPGFPAQEEVDGGDKPISTNN